uniref:CCHC-type domain-containing protein n=1 Tax=Angiostrongylus cantonensis TaxID=6313 RepID=A0A158PBI1_ANGCA
MSKRHRSRDSRDREHRRRPPPPFEHNDFEAVDMQISNGSDDEEINRMRFIDTDFDPHRGRHRNSIEREMLMAPSEGRIREGIVFEYVNYYEFLRCWLEESNNVLFKLSKSPLSKRVSETITPTTRAEKSRIILPAGVFDRDELLHCDMIITGLPPSVFFGSGFGNKSSLARNAAAKDLIDKCYRIGLITEALHTSIGNHPFFKKKELPRRDYSLAVDALVDLDRKISSENWPWDLCIARELEPDTLDRLRAVFTAVMDDIYFRGREHRRSDYQNSQMATNGSTAARLNDSQEKMEFCRRCNLYGHVERYCREGRSNSRERFRARSPPPPPNPRMDYLDERDHLTERYRRSNDMESDARRYTPDEIAQKIAQQREDLLRREMMLRHSEPAERWVHRRVPPQSLFSPIEPGVMPQPLLSLNGSSVDMLGKVHQRGSPRPPGDPMFLEEQLRTAQGEKMRAKLEAKARMLEEDKRLKQKEEELEWRMQKELELKKRALEVEIRRKVQLEERAKLQMELSRTYQQAMHSVDQPFSSFPSQNLMNSAYPFPSFSSTFAPATTSTLNGSEGNSYSSAPDFEMEEIKRLVKETEEKLLDLQRNCREAELSAIFQSHAFQMVAQVGDNAHMLDRTQKQNLLRELKELLSQAGAKESEKRSSERRRSRSRDRESRRERSRDRRDRDSSRRSRSRSRLRDSYKRWKESGDFKEVRVQVGNITLRNLSPVEQRALKVGEIVVAQDMKTGKWTTARIVKVVGKRATLGIGNTTWKKDLDELYKEVPDWSA